MVRGRATQVLTASKQVFMKEEAWQSVSVRPPPPRFIFGKLSLSHWTRDEPERNRSLKQKTIFSKSVSQSLQQGK